MAYYSVHGAQDGEVSLGNALLSSQAAFLTSNSTICLPHPFIEFFCKHGEKCFSPPRLAAHDDANRMENRPLGTVPPGPGILCGIKCKQKYFSNTSHYSTSSVSCSTSIAAMATATATPEMTTFPPQTECREAKGAEHKMDPAPQIIREDYKGAHKLKGKVAVITGADSGIGRAVAVHFAREGAEGVVVCYHTHDDDAKETQRLVEMEGAKCILIGGDVADSAFCNQVIEKTIKEFGHLDVLVNNAAQQTVCDDITKMDPATIERTFRTNIYSVIFLCRAAWPHLHRGASIINTTSVNAYAGHSTLLDYTATKGAIVSFTRALSMSGVSKGIRCNAVAPGPIWTPLIPGSMPEEQVEKFGQGTPMSRAGQPSEVAPAYVFLASEDASYISGQTLHPNGGRVVNA